MGQKCLASGLVVSMRLWENVAPRIQEETRSREYETVGYAIKERAELDIEGQRILLNEGDSWVALKGSCHSFIILESVTAVETTTLTAQDYDRDE
ncbi:MAG TPA: hypothetical protein PLO50_00545 [Nitrospira sp.]|nr:hypothetical protein [Nitrospira sp.]